MSKFFTPTLAHLTPYTPGEQPQDMQYIKLNTNENPYPPSPKAVAAITAAECEKLRLYSDPACADLIASIAQQYGLATNQVMVGNGSDENLYFALRAFCDEARPLAVADITYGCYAVWCDLLRVPMDIIPLREDFTLCPADYHGKGETIVIANPNAPTGIALTPVQIEGVLQTNPNNVVIVDEAYIDFGAQSCVSLIANYPNLLVVQTYSKSRSLAGARLGFAMGDAALIADLNAVKFSLNPYNVNRLTLVAGAAAMADTEYFAKTCSAITQTRALVCTQLEALGFSILPSQTNFLFAKHGKCSGDVLYQKLKESGVLVRHFGAPRIAEYLRITIGTPAEMEVFLHKLSVILQEV
ncbi:MAG: histidinol-phosphate transaminase [Faecalibacterium sp.]